VHEVTDTVNINAELVSQLISSQFPQWARLPITPVKLSGWDNRTFHLGDEMSVRLPSAAHYAKAIQKEQTWLPRLATSLPRPIPEPLAMGQPEASFPWHWSIYRWLPGDVATHGNVDDLPQFAEDLADFLLALQSIESHGGPVRTLRGGSLEMYADQTEAAMAALNGRIDVAAAELIWRAAVETSIRPASGQNGVWYHGDVAAGNLLVRDGRLAAVIDFGGLGVGDPACDLSIAWTFLDPPSRAVFRGRLGLSMSLWNRGRGWALWKAMIVFAGLIETNAIEAASAEYALTQLIDDFHANG